MDIIPKKKKIFFEKYFCWGIQKFYELHILPTKMHI